MDVDRTDLSIFVYNAGVVLSGGYVAFTFEMSSYAELVPFSLGLAFLWTLYYRFVMKSKLQPREDKEGDEREECEQPPQADDPDDDKPPEERGPDAPWE